jgi:hypothetical protein
MSAAAADDGSATKAGGSLEAAHHYLGIIAADRALLRSITGIK